MIHVMLDLETAGRAPDGAILQVGACSFDPTKGPHCQIEESFSHFVSPTDAAKHGSINMETVQWWLRQNRRLANAMFSGTEKLDSVLRQFSDWYARTGARRIWANGTTFDMPILEHGFASVGMRPPYHYRLVRDMRLLRDFGGIAVPPPRTIRNRHDALDDAINQANAVHAVYQHLLEKGVAIQ